MTSSGDCNTTTEFVIEEYNLYSLFTSLCIDKHISNYDSHENERYRNMVARGGDRGAHQALTSSTGVEATGAG